MLRFVLIATVVSAGALAAATPAPAAFPGDNGRILFDSPGSGNDTDIWTMRPNGGKPVNLTAGSEGNDSAASWRPDGRRIVYMSDRETPRNPDPRGKRGPDFELFVMRADGSDTTQLTDNTFDDEDPAWSPDGKQIVFQRDFNSVPGKVRYDILTMNADGTGEQNITDRPGDDFQPNWSSKGKIAFTSDRDGDTEIYTMSPNGAKVRKVTRNDLNDEFANWSPDGKTIAFHRTRNDNFDVYTMRAKGGGLLRLTRNPAPEGVPSWSPDGREIAYVRFSDAGPSIYTMRADGRDKAKLTGKALEPFASDWQALR